FFLFFSSRRRHTRLQGDWSSDVCLSDLGEPLDSMGRTADGAFLIDLSATLTAGLLHAGQSTTGHTITVLDPGSRTVSFDPSVSRSEERRVGKEGRTRWGTWSRKEESIMI